jgi:hypothetical protein
MPQRTVGGVPEWLRAWYWQVHVRRFDSGRRLLRPVRCGTLAVCQYHACCSGISETNPGQTLGKNPLLPSSGFLSFRASDFGATPAGVGYESVDPGV